MRKAPSSKGTILGTFNSGEKITVLSIKNGWAKVEYGKTVGYVNAKYIQELPQKTQEEAQKFGDVPAVTDPAGVTRAEEQEGIMRNEPIKLDDSESV